MSRLLDILALLMLMLAVTALCAGVFVMGGRDDIGALFLLVAGVVLLRSCVDLLRPRSAG
jgi:hypothetical protein